MAYADIIGDFDPVEVFIAGIEAMYDDKRERIAATLAAAEWMRQHRIYGASRLEDYYDDSEKIEAGICPNCGGEVEEVLVYEPHPYGATVAYERLIQHRCEHCGLL